MYKKLLAKGLVLSKSSIIAIIIIVSVTVSILAFSSVCSREAVYCKVLAQ